MKSTVYFFLFATMCSFGQLKISENSKPIVLGQVGKTPHKIAEIYSIPEEKFKDYYVFYYRDQQYERIVEFKSFIFYKKDIDEMYNLFLGAERQPDTSVSVDLPDGGELNFRFMKNLPFVIHTDKKGITGTIAMMSKKKLAKLFSKK